jgi:hypothetical protein
MEGTSLPTLGWRPLATMQEESWVKPEFWDLTPGSLLVKALRDSHLSTQKG